MKETQVLNVPIDSIGICESCNKQEGEYCINPYIEDTEGREEWEYICIDCYRAMLSDI